MGRARCWVISDPGNPGEFRRRAWLSRKIRKSRLFVGCRGQLLPRQRSDYGCSVDKCCSQVRAALVRLHRTPYGFGGACAEVFGDGTRGDLGRWHASEYPNQDVVTIVHTPATRPNRFLCAGAWREPLRSGRLNHRRSESSPAAALAWTVPLSSSVRFTSMALQSTTNAQFSRKPT
jgi:hypothetical protein